MEIRLVVRSDTEVRGEDLQVTYCGRHPRPAGDPYWLGAPSRVGRLALRDGRCPLCALALLREGRAVLAEDHDGLRGDVSIQELYTGATDAEAAYLADLERAAAAAGAGELAALLAGLRRAIGRPGSSEATELRNALRQLVGDGATAAEAPHVAEVRRRRRGIRRAA